MEDLIIEKLDLIAEKKLPKDIKFVQSEIGRIRVYAEKQHGQIKWWLHREANEIEKELNKILNIP
jgi:hypothetical protein